MFGTESVGNSGKAGGAVFHVRDQIGEGPSRPRLDVVLPCLRGGIHRGRHAGHRPGDQVADGVGVAGNVGEDVAAGPPVAEGRPLLVAFAQPVCRVPEGAGRIGDVTPGRSCRHGPTLPGRGWVGDPDDETSFRQTV